MSYIISYHYTSNIGKYRKNNQDNLYCGETYLDCVNGGTDGIISGKVSTLDQPVFAVFDGMGGEEWGEKAAYIAAKELSEYSFGKELKQGYIDYCRSANAKICACTEENGLTSMGTTAAILRFTKEKVCLCNIGDSKIFQLSEGRLQQISCDHVGVAVFGKKPPLSQNLGIPESELIISPYIASGEYNARDIYLICSDGLTDMVPEADIKDVLLSEKGEAAAGELLYRALDNGGKDNITFILLYVEKKKLFSFNKL